MKKGLKTIIIIFIICLCLTGCKKKEKVVQYDTFKENVPTISSEYKNFYDVSTSIPASDQVRILEMLGTKVTNGTSYLYLIEAYSEEIKDDVFYAVELFDDYNDKPSIKSVIEIKYNDYVDKDIEYTEATSLYGWTANQDIKSATFDKDIQSYFDEACSSYKPVALLGTKKEGRTKKYAFLAMDTNSKVYYILTVGVKKDKATLLNKSFISLNDLVLHFLEN